MNRRSTFSVTRLRTLADKLLAAAHWSMERVATFAVGARPAPLLRARSSQSLNGAVNMLETLVAQRAQGIEERWDEIHEVLEQLRVVH